MIGIRETGATHRCAYSYDAAASGYIVGHCSYPITYHTLPV